MPAVSTLFDYFEGPTKYFYNVSCDNGPTADNLGYHESPCIAKTSGYIATWGAGGAAGGAEAAPPAQ